MSSSYKGFYKLGLLERLQALVDNLVISQEEKEVLKFSTSPSVQVVADKMIENTIGCFPLPLGLATNCVIDGASRLIPMATEETSIIAAACSASSWLQQHGANVITSQQGWGIVGQVHFVAKSNLEKVASYVLKDKVGLLEHLNKEVAPAMCKRSGGFFDIKLHYSAEDKLAVNLYFNPVDSMGANLVTQGAEEVKKIILTKTGVEGLMAIVSNSCDIKQTVAEVEVRGVSEDLVGKIVAASEVAEADPWRASTHNKGILNGISAVAIATGNDWRAIEASLHSFAICRPLATWSKESGVLMGRISGPLPVATVGGATCHPVAKICKKILQVENSQQLARAMMAVGLIQNLAALKALVTKGLVSGHMRLHIENIVMASGASAAEESFLRAQLTDRLKLTGRVSFSDAAQLLKSVREKSDL